MQTPTDAYRGGDDERREIRRESAVKDFDERDSGTDDKRGSDIPADQERVRFFGALSTASHSPRLDNRLNSFGHVIGAQHLRNGGDNGLLLRHGGRRRCTLRYRQPRLSQRRIQ